MVLLLIRLSSVFDILFDVDVDTANDPEVLARAEDSFSDTNTEELDVKESGIESLTRPSLLLATVLSIESLLLHSTLFALRFLSLLIESTGLSPPLIPLPPFKLIRGECDISCCSFCPKYPRCGGTVEDTCGSFLTNCAARTEEQALASDCEEPIDGGGVE